MEQTALSSLEERERNKEGKEEETWRENLLSINNATELSPISEYALPSFSTYMMHKNMLKVELHWACWSLKMNNETGILV